jgi:hypothetical protein
MIFNQTVKQLLEDFNIYPQAQSAPSTGPDQGMTTADVSNTFPSKIGTVLINKFKKKKNKNRVKREQKTSQS